MQEIYSNLQTLAKRSSKGGCHEKKKKEKGIPKEDRDTRSNNEQTTDKHENY